MELLILYARNIDSFIIVTVLFNTLDIILYMLKLEKSRCMYATNTFM